MMRLDTKMGLNKDIYMEKNINACLSHKSDDWATPKKLYEQYMIKGFIDPCPLYCDNNCLNDSYHDAKLFINPPFSKLNDFIKWIIEQVNNNCFVHLLMPVRTDTKYFKSLIDKYTPHIVFINHRLRFNDLGVAPFPTMILIIDKKNLLPSYDSVSLEDFIEGYL